MVPRPLAPAQAMRSRTCAHVIQRCRHRPEGSWALGTRMGVVSGGHIMGHGAIGCSGHFIGSYMNC